MRAINSRRDPTTLEQFETNTKKRESSVGDIAMSDGSGVAALVDAHAAAGWSQSQDAWSDFYIAEDL